MNEISIEKFAAFLDGNLSDDEMQIMASAIDADKEYSDILGDIMLVDEVVGDYMQHPDSMNAEIVGMDYELPVIPVFTDVADTVEVAVNLPSESDTVEVLSESTCLSMECDIKDEENEEMQGFQSPAIETSDSGIPYETNQSADETFDFGDLT